MANRKYPRNVWVLMPSFKPVEVAIVKPSYTHSPTDWDVTDKGKQYHLDCMFPTKVAAIAAGREQVKQQQADIDNRQANLNKRIAALDKAEAASGSKS